MENGVEIKWRIDAWDSLAGRAFLCCRQPDKDSTPQLDYPVVFVGPPYFQPEPLASRAPGFAATRSTFQSGLFFSDGAEVGFDTLEDAIAFIRRGYNSHGSEPLPGAPVPTRGGPIEGGGSGLALELPELAHAKGFRQLDQAISSLVIAFKVAEKGVRREGPATTVKWVPSDTQVFSHTRDMLVVAGHELVLEMLRRLPVNGNLEDYAVWANTACNLGLQLVRLEVWAEVRHEVSPKLLLLFKDKVLAKVFELASLDYDPKHLEHLERLLEILFLPQYWEFWEAERITEVEIYGQLASFPLPEGVSACYRNGDANRGKEASLLTLLSAWFGTPRSDSDITSVDRALLLFAGACVVVGPMLRESPVFRPWRIGQSQRLRNIFRARLGTDLWNWISKQLPDRVFHVELEDMLQAVTQPWSRIVEAKLADQAKGQAIPDLDSGEIAILEKELGEIISDVEEENVLQSFPAINLGQTRFGSDDQSAHES